MAEAPKTAEAAKTAAPTEEVLPAEVAVKNISKGSVYLSFGEIKPGELGKCSKAEFENFAGTYLEKA